MASAKETATRILEGLPEDASYDEILRELAFGRMIDRGVEDMRSGRTVSDEETRRSIESWRGK